MCGWEVANKLVRGWCYPEVMPKMTLHPIDGADVTELQFETENRAYFERSIAGFGDDYYNRKTLERITAERTKDRETVDAYYLVRDAAGELVGRVGLFDVQRGPSQMAVIGYRTAERRTGEGYVTRAVKQVLKDAFEVYGLHRGDDFARKYQVTACNA